MSFPRSILQRPTKKTKKNIFIETEAEVDEDDDDEDEDDEEGGGFPLLC